MLLAAASCRAFAVVDITGVEGEILENVTLYVPDRPACDADSETVARYTEDLPERLRPALEAFGYYSADIDATVQDPTEDCWQVQVEIAPGRQVMVRETSVQLRGAAEAEADPMMQTLFANFSLTAGDPLLHERYRTFKDGVEVLARQRGYLDGAFAAQRVDVFADEQAADILLVYDSGPRYQFGDVTFETDVLAEDVLESFLPFAEGDPFDASLVGQLQRELTASRYFASTTVVTDIRGAEDGRIPIRVGGEPSEPRSYTVGGGYSTDDGPRIRFSYDNDRRNRRGHQLHADTTLAEVRQTASIEYRVPLGNPQRDWRSYRLGLARDDFVAGVSSAARFSVHRTRAGEYVTTTRFIDVLFERDEVGSFSFSNSMLVPGISWLRNYRDDLARPREGHRLSLVLSGGWGTEVSLLRADFRGKWITALPWDARVLLRGRIGAMVEDGPFGFVPLSMRFFAGGDNSVRGYDYQSLGPRDQFGDLIGGNRLVEASVEYEHPLLDEWSVAAFVDSGNSFLDSGFETRTGAGIGARWFSPLGPVRLDIAWPLHGPDRSPELHLSLGPDL